MPVWLLVLSGKIVSRIGPRTDTSGGAYAPKNSDQFSLTIDTASRGVNDASGRQPRCGVCRLRRTNIGLTGLKRRKEPPKLDCEKLLVQSGNQFGHKVTGQSDATGSKPQPQRRDHVKVKPRIFK